MIDCDTYLNDKESRIAGWIAYLSQPHVLCRDSGDDVRMNCEARLDAFTQNLHELKSMFCEFKELNEHGGISSVK